MVFARGYVVEGSYFIFREMFENESQGTSFVNWTENVAGAELLYHSTGGSNNQLMLRMNHGADIQHDGAMDPNDFVQDFAFTLYIPSSNTASGKCYIDLLDSLGNQVVSLYIMGRCLYIYSTTAAAYLTTPLGAPTYTYDEWHDARIIIHNANSYFDTVVELLIDGYRLWEITVPNSLQNSAVGTDLHKITDATISYIRIYTADTTYGDYWDFGGFICKDWADMNENAEDCPFSMPIAESNDKAHWIKLRNFVSNISYSQLYNEATEARLMFNPLDVNDAIENIIPDTEDNDFQHIYYDNYVFLFQQMSVLLYHFYKATSVNNILTDTISDFTAPAIDIQAGDRVWLFRRDCAVDNPYTVTNVAAHALTLDKNINGGAATTDISYLICRGQERIYSQALGDYVFQGRYKNRKYQWVDGDPGIELLLLDEYYVAIQHHLYCKSNRYYKKYLDEILYGHWHDPPDQVVDGLNSLGNYAGIIGTLKWDALGAYTFVHDAAFLKNTNDVVFDSRYNKIATKLWDITTTLYDALRSVAETLELQMMCYVDLEFRNERILFFRDRLDFDVVTPLFNIYAGDATYAESETSRSLIAGDLEQGTRDYVDRTVAIGATAGDDSGLPLYGDEPPNYQITPFTRDAVINTNSARTQTLVNDNAVAMYRELHRILNQGTFRLEPFSMIETWFNNIYVADSAVRTYYERIPDAVDTFPGSFFYGDSDWFNNVPAWRTANQKDRTLQGHLYRKPFSPIGEVMRYYFTNTEYFNGTINRLTVTFNKTVGILYVIEPNVVPYSVSRQIADTKREISFVEELFKDPLVGECTMEPLPKEYGYLEDHVQGALVDCNIANYTSAPLVPPVVGQQRITIPPIQYEDEVGYSTAYAYAFFKCDPVYFPPGGTTWGNWIALPVVGMGGLNYITDIDDATSLIMIQNGVSSHYGNAAGFNFVDLDNGGAGNQYVLIILVSKHIMLAHPIIHYIPRGINTMDQSTFRYRDEYYHIPKSPDGIVPAGVGFLVAF